MKITHIAASQPTSDILEFLHKEGLSLVEEDNSTDRAHPIHYAAFKNSLPCLKYLIANNSHINIQDAQGLTPLHFAVVTDSESCAKYLVEAGASVDILSSVTSKQQGMSPLDYAESLRLGHLKAVMRRYSKE
mmetsp:Transcript_24275/g.43194  ORF Transcript_24275/g.43194 Transcript_24275/m.43194 type:complete len:132 (-) Transcript_24275:61-456(-)